MGLLESATVKNIQTKPPGAGPGVRFGEDNAISA